MWEFSQHIRGRADNAQTFTLILLSNWTVMPHHILLSASEVRIKCILVITFKGILLIGHRLRFYCPDHSSFPLTPPRGGGMTSLLGEI